MKSKLTVAEYLVSRLEDAGVEYVFGYPGEQVLNIYEALRSSGIKHVLMGHEQGAVHAADVYARVTGRCGVCLTTAGPGALNTVMGVGTAYKDNVPLIVITGDVCVDSKGSDHFQDIDLNAVFKPITIKSFYVSSCEVLDNCIEEIFSSMSDGVTGPFHINIAKDVQNELMNTDHRIIRRSKVKGVSEKSILDTVRLIDESERPLIIAGSGVIYADSVDELKVFVKKTGIPLTTTFHARGVISEDDPMNLGLTGARTTSKAEYATENADLILALGTRLSERTLKHVRCDNIVQVNTNKEHKYADNFHHANVKDFLDNLNKNDFMVNTASWLNDISHVHDEINHAVRTNGDLIHPEDAVMEVVNRMDDRVTVVLDAGTTPTYYTINTNVKKPSQIVFSGGLAPMGYALPGSIGASFARPNDIIIAATGDGAIQMTIEELAVISRYDLPVIIVVINNNLLGIIKQWQDMNDYPNYQVKMTNPDFVAIAQAYGIEASNITSLDDFGDRLDKAISDGKPYLFNVLVGDVPIPLPR